MGSIANVVLRGRIFHFRRRVPDTLRPRLRLQELVRSLATTDLRAAKARACQVSETWISETWTSETCREAHCGPRLWPGPGEGLTDKVQERVLDDRYRSVRPQPAQDRPAHAH